MSRVTVKPASIPCPSLMDLVGVPPRLLALSLGSAQQLVEQAARILLAPVVSLGSLRQAMSHAAETCGCEIPETHCPPHCACEIAWEASPGETLRCAVRVTNSTTAQHTFAIHATPFSGPSGPAGTITVAPAALPLPPGASGVVTATFAVPPDFAPGQYQAEILIDGAYEQAVCVTLCIQDPQHCHCEVVQGERPFRIRAHHWYDHFQCVEPCEPVRKAPPSGHPGAAAGSR